MIDWRPAGAGSAPGSVFEVVHRHARERPERVALVHVEPDQPDETLTYAALVRDALVLASGLVERGLRGKPVGLLFPPGTEFVAALLATMAAGAVAVPIPPAGRRRERASGVLSVLRDCGAAHLIASGRAGGSDDLHDELRRGGIDVVPATALADSASGRPLTGPRADELAVLQYTSGSTSRPKGVELRHATILANEAMIRTAFGHDADSTVVGWTPHFHDQGLFGNVVQPLYLAQRTCSSRPRRSCATRSTGWRTSAAFAPTPRAGPTSPTTCACGTCGAASRPRSTCRRGASPTTARSRSRPPRCARSPPPSRRTGFARMRSCRATAWPSARSTPPVGTAARGAAWRSFDTLALAGGGVLPAASGAPATEIVSCGPPGAGAEIAVVDPAGGGLAAPGRIGELLVRGPHVAAGYWGRPEESARTFGATVPGRAGSFLRTGDLGFLFEEELYVTGRLKDLIIVRGRNIYPHDVEQACESASEVLAPNGSAAFGLDGEEQGMVLVADVARAHRHRVDADAVGKQLRAAVLAALEVGLTDVVLVAPGAVPKTTSGKVMRGAARTLLLEGKLPVIAASGPLAARLQGSRNRDLDPV